MAYVKDKIRFDPNMTRDRLAPVVDQLKDEGLFVSLEDDGGGLVLTYLRLRSNSETVKNTEEV